MPGRMPAQEGASTIPRTLATQTVVQTPVPAGEAPNSPLPTILGYLLAGVAVGPFTPGFVADAGLASQLAEIGVILLMFGVGLHFSIGDLVAVRRIAVPGAIAQIAAATGLGALLAYFWGWSWPTHTSIERGCLSSRLRTRIRRARFSSTRGA